MKTRFFRHVAVCAVFLCMAGGLWAVDVSIVSPTITIDGTPYTIDVSILEDYADDISNDPEVQKYSDQPNLAKGFADAGAASALSGLFKSPHNYKIFSISYGFGLAVTLPESLSFSDYQSENIIEREGDIYTGMALHPFNLSAGINLGFLLSGLRANVKFGYFDLTAGTFTDEYAFTALSFGAGLQYQLVKPKSIAVGLFKWQGLNVASGLYYQKTTVKSTFVADDSGFDYGSGIQEVDLGFGGATTVGYLSTTPEITATIEASTFTIPLEVSTGARILYIIDLTVGAGVDLAFGTGEVGLSATQRVEFDVDGGYAGVESVTPGRVSMSNKTTTSPTFFRPRLMGGVGFGAGPVKFEIPFTVYFDSDGNTYVTGITAGFML